LAFVELLQKFEQTEYGGNRVGFTVRFTTCPAPGFEMEKVGLRKLIRTNQMYLMNEFNEVQKYESAKASK
jgi:hypothetical protein